jgi:hypothetical protein
MDTKERKELKKKVKAFVQSEAAFVEMRVATDLGRPAAESLSKELIALNVKRNDDAMKQWIGKLTRDVLYARGYEIDQVNCLVRTGNLFAKATRYKKAAATVSSP